jgi:lipopolysaccharide biosynthesis protein/glycosyltransferase involved in cell wall biosynthesis
MTYNKDIILIKESGLFDEDYYYFQYPDIKAAGIDALEHYLNYGWKEGRNPNPHFETSYYMAVHKDIEPGMNPLLHYVKFGIAENRATQYSYTPDFESEETFEYPKPINIEIKTLPVKTIAFYLPQYHPIPENDNWWGRNFTDWINVSKAKPNFDGHYQPHIPYELGFYDLRVPDVMNQQIEMAKLFGIYGFCFYYYWFDGKRLLDKPLEMFLEHQEWNFNFCICWANENWTRRWDGKDSEILISQNHSDDDDLSFIRGIIKLITDPRYIKIDGKPLIIVYRPSLFPDMKRTVQMWRNYCRENGVGEIMVGMTQTFGEFNPLLYNLDFAVEFPPHNIAAREITKLYNIEDEYSGHIFDGKDMLKNINLKNTPIAYKWFRGLMMNWDNTARRGLNSNVYLGITPDVFRRWFRSACKYAIATNPADERFVFINAWNEWAEGTHLEPCYKMGYSYLNRIGSTLSNLSIENNEITSPPVMFLNASEAEKLPDNSFQTIPLNTEGKIKGLRNSITQKIVTNADKNDTIALQQVQLSSFKKTINKLDQELNEKMQLVKEYSESINNLNNQNEDLQKNIDQLTQQIEEKTNHILKKENTIAELTRQIDDKTNLILKKDKIIVQINQQLNSKDLQIEEKNNLAREKEEYILQLEATQKEYINEIEKLQSDLSIKSELISEKEGIIFSKQKLIDHYFYELSNLKNSIFYKISKTISDYVSVFNYRQIISRSQKKKKDNELEMVIEKSGFFDRQYYLTQNPDVKKSGIDPVKHFLHYGGFELRNPSEKFNTSYYIGKNADVVESGMNPLVHYLLYGKEEGRLISPVNRAEPEKTENNFLQPENFKNKANNTDEEQLLREIETIRNSGLFDENYYLSRNSDIKAAGADAVKHFCCNGWKEGRNPNPDFETNYYLDSNPDVKSEGYNPLIHYILWGKEENRLTKPIEIDEKKFIEEADISDVDFEERDLSNLKIAVVCHLYFSDLADEFLRYFNNIKIPYDLYISTLKENVEILKKNFVGNSTAVKVYIFGFENKGRDIGPFIELLKSHLFNYDLVCKVHSKKSRHELNLSNWRSYLLEHLLGSDKIIEKIIAEFIDDKELGLICPVTHPFISHSKSDKGWGLNKDIALKHFPNSAINTYDEFFFPTGSMFWFRPQALDSLKSKEINLTDFETEDGKIDGTLAHTIERMFGILPLEAGYKIKKVFFPEEIRRSANSLKLIKGSNSILFISHDLALAGAQMLLFHIMNWFNDHTSLKLYLLALKPGFDGGKLSVEFKKICGIYMWEELLINRTEEESVDFLIEQTGSVDLIYGNTVIAPVVYELLSKYNVPIITHIHELEESIKLYATPVHLENMKKYTTLYIPCSEPVKTNLNINHKIPPEKLKKVDAFIQPSVSVILDQSSIRKQFSLSMNKTIVWGCGTIYWRKGVDLFIQTAKLLKDLGTQNFEFIWIGLNYWKSDSEPFGLWSDWENYIKENELETIVTFLGEIENPKRYFLAGDLFYLPSREDPFPLVCLEAAECQLPVVCFEEAGGIPSFIENDGGIVVPFLDTLSAAKEIKFFIENETERKEKGKIAREKLIKRHSADIAVPEIIKICHNAMKSAPLVSVIIPVYNQEKFIEERINSVLNQTFRDVEIFIIDDCSTDKSYELIKKYESHPAINIIKNEKNSGSVFLQWEKGIQLAKGMYIWIAEGDDIAEPKFLETLLPAFNDPEVNLSYCASNTIDENGSVEKEHYLKIGHYNNLNFPKSRWLDNYTCKGIEEIENSLAVRNTIPNVSAVLMRTDGLRQIDFKKCSSFRCGGDWYTYISIIENGKIHYSPIHLNYHRIHAKSVVGENKMKAENTLPDYFEMHRFILNRFSINERVKELMIQSVTQGLRNIWPDLSEEEFNILYDIKKLDR